MTTAIVISLQLKDVKNMNQFYRKKRIGKYSFFKYEYK